MTAEPMIRVRCACGWETVGPETAAVAETQDHGRRVHNMSASRDDVLAMATPTEGEATRPEPARPDRADGSDGRPADPTVADNPAASRYEARLGDRVVGFSEYRMIRGRIVFLHTEVNPDMEGGGIGSRIAAGALADVRARGLRLAVKCPFIGAWMRRHPEFDDLLA